MAEVSVVIPVHNSGKYLRQCVDSVLNQTLEDIEVILVENGSTDNSLELCHRIASDDQRVKVTSIEKGDLSAARNEGVRIASAGYIGFVDSDDTVVSDMYERMYDTIIRNNADVANCNYVKIYNNGRPPKYQYCEDGKETVLSPKEMISLNMKEEISQSACTLLVRKSIVENLKFEDGILFEDRRRTFMFYTMAERCVRINKSFYRYHQYRGSIAKKGRKNFRINYYVADADRIRLSFIRNSGMFTPEEQRQLASKSAESFLRKLGRMSREYSSPDEKNEMIGIMKAISLIPDRCALSLKARIIRFAAGKFLQK